MTELNYRIEALVAAVQHDGWRWNAATSSGAAVPLTYSFNTSLPTPRSDVTDVRPFTEDQKADIREALAAFTAVTGLTFYEVPEAAKGTLSFTYGRFTGSMEWAAGFASYPSSGTTYQGSSGIYLDTADLSDFSAGEWAFETVLHEIGHAVGLKHPHEGDDQLPVGEDTSQNTVMSYNNVWPPRSSLGPFDVEALTYLYGSRADFLNAGITYSWNPGALTLTTQGNDKAQALIGINHHDIIRGGGGNDSIFAYAGNDNLDGGGGADSLSGGEGNDTLLSDGRDVALAGGNGQDLADFRSAGAGLRIASDSWYSLTFQVNGLSETGTLTEVEKLIASGFDDVMEIRYGTSVTIDGASGADRARFFSDIGYASVDVSANGTITVNGITLISIETIEFNNGSRLVAGTGSSEALDGGTAADRLLALGGNDRLDGRGGADTLEGGTGNDTYLVDTASDVILENEGAGDDLVLADINFSLAGRAHVERLSLTGTANVSATGNDLANILTGNAGANSMAGGGGTDSLSGGEGNDTLDGGSGADTAAGGGGNDLYIVDSSGDRPSEIVNGSSDAGGTDTVRASVSHTLESFIEHLALTGGAVSGTGNSLANRITGNAVGNTLTGHEGADTLDGREGADTLYGGSGSDLYIVDNVGDQVVEPSGAGADTVQSTVTYALGDTTNALFLAGSAAINGTGNWAANHVFGNAADNRLDGAGDKDTLAGHAGNDTLIGGTGNDLLQGGTGNDLYIVDAGDTVQEATQPGGSTDAGGADTVQSAVGWTLNAFVENLVLSGGEAVNGTGNNLANVIAGNGAANRLDGAAGNDTLIANGGNDTLVGGDGQDRMQGGAGNDLYIVGAGDTIFEATVPGGQVDAGGNDTVQAARDWTLGEFVEGLTITTAAGAKGTGNKLANTILGGTGADTLDGAAGADTLAGGGGNDLYIVDNTADQVREQGGQGYDIVQASVTWTMSDFVQRLVLTGSGKINGTGTASGDNIIGNAAANALNGLDGNDTLTAAAGDDTLSGGTGDDLLQGGSGNDLYIADAGDRIEETTLPNGTIDSGGSDTVRTALSWTLGSFLENLELTGGAALTGTGNALANRIIGNGGANQLDGAAGNDTLTGGGGGDTLTGGLGNDLLIGGAGNDLYIVGSGDTVQEGRGKVDDGGNDTVQAASNWALGELVEVLVITAASGVRGTGNALANTIRGHDGGDTLDGRGGADTLIGGSGHDLYIVDNGRDAVVEVGGGGADTVQTSATYTLGGAIEELALTGSARIDGTGNALANTIAGNAGANLLSGADGNDTLTGNAGNDTLDGGKGADLLRGGAGNDLYIVDAADTIQDVSGGGTDTVRSAGTWVLDDLLENLELAGDVAASGTGNKSANTLIGNAAANRLDGRTGNDMLLGDAGDDTLVGGDGLDTMLGGSGDDLYIVDSSYDRVFERNRMDQTADPGGIDTVQAAVSWTLGDFVENLTLTGAGRVNGAGNALDNRIEGNLAANALNGNAGNDTLIGMGGNDTMSGREGADMFGIFVNGGRDLISDFTAGTDRLLFGGFGAAYDEASEILAVAVQAGASVVITLPNPGAGAQTVVTLANLALADLQASDLWFT